MSLFANGSEYWDFDSAFCSRCSKCIKDDEGMPKKGNCEIENMIGEGIAPEAEMLDRVNGVFVENGRSCRFTCLQFKSEKDSVNEAFNNHLQELREKGLLK